ncbi:MFS general substrate transporter [Xylariomycetidae sp. FL2044]|nr:MFS general substrate transporter [Xylariomycetidae sp. FL2044]
MAAADPGTSDGTKMSTFKEDNGHDAALSEKVADLKAGDPLRHTITGNAEDILGLQDLDPALNAKMHLVNDAIDEIGWTNYHWKLFVLNGFGYAVDSLVLLLQGNIATPAFKEFGEVGYSAGLNVSVYAGMLTGAVFWGLGADMIGRRWAFNISLFVCSAATIVAGAAPSWASLGFFIAMIGFGGGGNLVLDTTVFLEYLPSNKQWVLTLLACWWGLGQAVTGFICWGFLVPAKWNCEVATDCPRESNQGWRYVMYTAGALVFAMSVARITVIRFKETPKYRLGAGEDRELVETLQSMAREYDRPCSLTVEQLEACGPVQGAHSESRVSFRETAVHLSGLFATRKIGISTSLIWLSWTLIGLAYPLFYVFLSSYLETRGAYEGVGDFAKWRNYTLTNISGIFGPVLAGYMCDVRVLGRRYTMVIGALLTMAFFFAYTAVTTPDQDVGFSCAIGFCINIYYGCLYAYTPEVLPSAHRATGNGVAVACNRVMGIVSSVVATTADTRTVAPIYVCAALYLAMAVVAVVFPFEPYGRRSS